MRGPESLNALDWNRFLERSQADARTALGKAATQALADPANWAPDVVSARLLQQETQEAAVLLERDSFWGPLSGLEDPNPSIELLAKGAVLDVSGLAEIRRWLYVFESWIQIPREELRGDRLRKDIGRLVDPIAMLKSLDRILTPEGELSENASSRLAALHAETRALKREISQVLDQVIKDLGARGVLQESFSDLRDGRYVVPVRISAQGEVPGTIYEASASRQSVFIEPREVALVGNRLRQKQNEILQEVHAILEAACKRLEPRAGEIAESVGVVAHWDAVQARARFGRRYSGKAIYVSDDQAFYLRQTAHPLLWWSLPPDTIVRNDIDFGEPARAFLLTGPNTGGKTVLLKTLGLAGICARTGFPFPATDLPKVPFFDAYFVDLGDPQSIEEHLSSFSGHVLRYKEILEGLTSRSLVLLDELNSATDPEEGAALGRAFLETIIGRGALVVATTHDPHLKALAVADERIENASMAFDEASRTPTYRIVAGIPGRSRALETAERLGIPAEILMLARSYLSREHNQFEEMLGRLEADVLEAARARKEAVLAREQAEALKKEWTEKTEIAVGEMLERTRGKLKKILEAAQDEVRSSVRKLDEMRNRREIDQTRSELGETLAAATSRLETALKEEAPEVVEALARKQAEAPPSPKPTDLASGMIVRVPKWKTLGTVLEVAGQKIRVALGTLQMTLDRSDVEPATSTESRQLKSNEARKAKVPGAVSSHDSSYGHGPGIDFSIPTPTSRLDLRGQRLDDAMTELGRYLDHAYRSGSLLEVTIVHGLGTGAIREGARKLLASLPYVKEFRDGGAGNGGAGATVVEFER